MQACPSSLALSALLSHPREAHVGADADQTSCCACASLSYPLETVRHIAHHHCYLREISELACPSWGTVVWISPPFLQMLGRLEMQTNEREQCGGHKRLFNKSVKIQRRSGEGPATLAPHDVFQMQTDSTCSERALPEKAVPTLRDKIFFKWAFWWMHAALRDVVRRPKFAKAEGPVIMTQSCRGGSRRENSPVRSSHFRCKNTQQGH